MSFGLVLLYDEEKSYYFYVFSKKTSTLSLLTNKL